MIETATIITLCMLFLIFFRPGKTPPLENPLVIERAGKYHLTLAPQLNLAQTFIEDIFALVAASNLAGSNSATQVYQVKDKQVTAHGFDFYLLAITRRDGMLYFQAVRPPLGGVGHLAVALEFSDSVLKRFPASDDAVVPADDIDAAVQEAARKRNIQIKPVE